MGAGGISIGSLIVILAIVLLLFGTKKLKNLGGDLGGAIKGFKKAMNDDENAGDAKRSITDDNGKKDGTVYDAEVKREPSSGSNPK